MSIAFIPSCRKRSKKYERGPEGGIPRRASADATRRTVMLPVIHRHTSVSVRDGYSRAQYTIQTKAAMIDVLSTRDLVDGSLLAFSLAAFFSVLQQRRRPNDTPTMKNDETEHGNVFNAVAWKEMSRPENYVYYNSKLREMSSRKDEPKQEKKWILISLLVLFVPIFSVEFFLALSRQVLCGGDPLTLSAWASDLCSPHF